MIRVGEGDFKIWRFYLLIYRGFPGGSVIKNLPANAGDTVSILGSGRFPGERNGNPFQYSCLENSTDRGAWRAAVHGVRKALDMTACDGALTHANLKSTA